MGAIIKRMSKMRKVINLIAIEDRKILLVRKRETWILPGGKPKRHRMPP